MNQFSIRMFAQVVFVTLLLVGQLFPLSAYQPKQIEVDPNKKALSYELCGRLGNHLITYICAKWLSLKYHLPLLYIPFPYSDQFVFHEKELFYRSEWESFFKQTTLIAKETDITDLPDSTLISTNFFISAEKKKLSFHAYWNDPKFRKTMRAYLQPRFPVKTINLPKDRLTILTHVRTGGGYDSPKTRLRYPDRFPPHGFYTSAIELLSQLFKHAPIYVYIMTDDLHPEQIVKEYKKKLSHLKNIKFGYRRGKAGPDVNVLEDFFSIPKFDCLIRGNSTFSIAATLLADFKAIVSAKCHVENEEIVLNKIQIVCDDPTLNKKAQKLINNEK